MPSNFFDLKLNQENIKLLPEPKGEIRNFLMYELLNKNGVQLSELSYYGNVVMKHNYVYTISKELGHTDFYGLLDNNIIDVNAEADRLLQENPEANSVIFYLLRIELDEYKEPETSNLITGSKSRNRRNFAYFMDTYREAPKYELEKLITAIYPKFEGFNIRHRGIIEELQKRKLTEETKNFLEFFSVSINRLIEKYVETCLIDGEREVLDKILSLQGELLDEYQKQELKDITEKFKQTPRNRVLQEIAINPKLIQLHESKLNDELMSFRLEDFNGGEQEKNGLVTAKHDYKGEYYKNSRRVKVNNSVSVHHQKDNFNLTDFSNITEFVDVDEAKLKALVKSTKIVLTPEDMEVYNGISTCVLYYLHRFNDRTFKDHCEIPLSYDDIAIGMGYSGATESILNQIIVALSKFDRLRITNHWKEEAEARGINLNKAVDLYGETVLYSKIPKLLNFDIAPGIYREKAPKSRRTKDGKTVQYDGKPGIVINQIPPLTIYHKLTNQTINIPADWLRISGTGQSQQLKRIKRYLAKRLNQLIHFMEKEQKKSKRDKRDFNPNKGNKNKIVIDTLLTEIGGYDLTPYTKGEMITVKDPKTKVLISRPATEEDVRKRNNAIGVKRKAKVNQIIKFLKELQKREPRLKKILVEDKDGGSQGKEYAIRLIVG